MKEDVISVLFSADIGSFSTFPKIVLELASFWAQQTYSCWNPQMLFQLDTQFRIHTAVIFWDALYLDLHAAQSTTNQACYYWLRS